MSTPAAASERPFRGMIVCPSGALAELLGPGPVGSRFPRTKC